MPPEQPTQLPEDPSQEHLLVNQDEHGKNLAALGEHHLVAQGSTTEAVKNLAPILDHIVMNTAPKDVQKIEIVQPTENENELAKAFWQMLRGQTGPQGEKGDKGDQGDQGAALTWDMLTPEQKAGLVGAQGPAGLAGESVVGPKGEPGPEGPRGEDGAPGADGKTGKNGKDGRTGKDGSSDSAKQIIEKIRGLLSYDDLTDAPDIVSIIRRHVSSRDYDLAELKDVVLGTPADGHVLTYSAATGKWIPVASGGGVTVEMPTGTIDGVNTQFTPTARPKWVVADGTTYYENSGYTWDGTHINISVAPSEFIRDII